MFNFPRSHGTPTKDTSKFKRDLERAIRADPLYELSSAEKELIWKFRIHCTTIPEALPKLLRSVNWADLEQVREIPSTPFTAPPIISCCHGNNVT